jgi:hypothetical protein
MTRRKETTIERIYREVTGNKMLAAVKRILLPKQRSSGINALGRGGTENAKRRVD